MLAPPEQVTEEREETNAQPKEECKTYDIVVPGLHLASTVFYATGSGLLIGDFILHRRDNGHDHPEPVTTQVPLTSPATPEYDTGNKVVPLYILQLSLDCSGIVHSSHSCNCLMGSDCVGSAVELTVRGFLLAFLIVTTIVSLRLYVKKRDFPWFCWFLYFVVGLGGCVLDIIILVSGVQKFGSSLAARVYPGTILCIIASAMIVVVGGLICKSKWAVYMRSGTGTGDNQPLIPNNGSSYGTQEPVIPIPAQDGTPAPESSPQREHQERGTQGKATAQKGSKDAPKQEQAQQQAQQQAGQQATQHQDPLKPGTSQEVLELKESAGEEQEQQQDQQQDQQQQDQQQQDQQQDQQQQDQEHDQHHHQHHHQQQDQEQKHQEEERGDGGESAGHAEAPDASAE